MISNLKTILLVLVSTLLALVLGDRLVGLAGIERFQTWLELHPEGFMMNQQGGTAWQEFQGGEITYSFRENRLRKSNEPFVGKRIVLLGDSFCFGLYLPDSSTTAYKMNRRSVAESAEMIFLNAGVGGTGTADHVLLLETFGESWRPDAVILQLNSDDIDRAMSKNLFVLKGDSLVRSKRWRATELQHQFRTMRGYRWFQRHSFVYAAIEKLAWSTVFFEDMWEEGDSTLVVKPKPEEFYLESGYSNRLTEHLMLRMKKWCDDRKIPFVVVYNGFVPPDEASAYTREFLKTAPEFFNSQKIPFYDLTKVVSEAVNGDKKALILFPDTHPNDKGTDVLAREIFGISVDG